MFHTASQQFWNRGYNLKTHFALHINKVKAFINHYRPLWASINSFWFGTLLLFLHGPSPSVVAFLLPLLSLTSSTDVLQPLDELLLLSTDEKNPEENQLIDNQSH